MQKKFPRKIQLQLLFLKIKVQIQKMSKQFFLAKKTTIPSVRGHKIFHEGFSSVGPHLEAATHLIVPKLTLARHDLFSYSCIHITVHAIKN